MLGLGRAADRGALIRRHRDRRRQRGTAAPTHPAPEIAAQIFQASAQRFSTPRRTISAETVAIGTGGPASLNAEL